MWHPQCTDGLIASPIFDFSLAPHLFASVEGDAGGVLRRHRGRRRRRRRRRRPLLGMTEDDILQIRKENSCQCISHSTFSKKNFFRLMKKQRPLVKLSTSAVYWMQRERREERRLWWGGRKRVFSSLPREMLWKCFSFYSTQKSEGYRRNLWQAKKTKLPPPPPPLPPPPPPAAKRLPHHIFLFLPLPPKKLQGAKTLFPLCTTSQPQKVLGHPGWKKIIIIRLAGFRKKFFFVTMRI